MADQNSQFMAILTAVGEARLANASALGVPWNITKLGVGDGNGAEPLPSRTQTALINERRRAPLNQLSIDPNNTAVVIAEQVIPEDVGGWWIREIGLYDEAGDLVAVANCPPTYKPELAQGSGRTQVVRLNILVSSTQSITLKIDPSVVLATRAYADQLIVGHLSAVDPHPQYATREEVNDLGARRLVVGAVSDQRPVLVSPTAGQTYADSALEIREAQAAAASGTTDDFAPAMTFHWGGLAAIRLWMGLDSALRWGTARVQTTDTGATQEQAEAGTNTTAWMSPLRVFQAIAKTVVQATETVLGMAKVATSAQVNAGTDDATIVTPKKLRLGFAFYPGANGYIALPSWLGGFIFQWGRITITQTAVNSPVFGNWNYTLAFPASCFATWAFQHTLGGSSGGSLLERICGGGEPGATQASFYIADADAAGSYTLRVFAIGN